MRAGIEERFRPPARFRANPQQFVIIATDATDARGIEELFRPQRVSAQNRGNSSSLPQIPRAREMNVVMRPPAPAGRSVAR
jgi:hypothetical protein